MADSGRSDAAGSTARSSSSARPTAHDVAALAGVSQPTVSRALRKRGGVSPETRERVLDAARSLGYRPDQRAVSLRGGPTNRIAIVVLTADRPEPDGVDPFYMSIMTHAVRAAALQGCETILSFQRTDKELYANYERDGLADGLIVMGSPKNAGGWRFFAEAHRAGANIVSWGSPRDEVPTVRCDNEAAATLAVQHLTSTGRTHVAFLGPDWHRQRSHAERRAGYLAAVASAERLPLEAPQSDESDREKQGEASTRALLTAFPHVDAICAASDLLAIGALRAIRGMGRRCPEDVSIVGFDGIASSRLVTPSLTTIEQDAEQAGRLLVDLVLMKGTSGGLTSAVATILVVRESSSGVNRLSAV